MGIISTKTLVCSPLENLLISSSCVVTEVCLNCFEPREDQGSISTSSNILFYGQKGKTRSIAWESAQLSTWVKFMVCDWLSLNRLENNGSRGRSKNNVREIMMGIGPIWGITSLTP